MNTSKSNGIIHDTSPPGQGQSRKTSRHTRSWPGYAALKAEAKLTGHLVLDAMEKKGMTFVTLNSILRGMFDWNVHNDEVYALIRGKKFPSVREVSALARALEIDPVEMIEAFILDAAEVPKYKPMQAELFDFYHWMRLLDRKPRAKRRKIALSAMEKEYAREGVAHEFAEMLAVYEIFQSIPQSVRPLFYAHAEALQRLSGHEVETQEETTSKKRETGPLPLPREHAQQECETY